jgi:hypothetical protein
MHNFIENAADACVGADVAAMLLLSEDGLDLELWPLRPEGKLTSREEFNRRQLRIVGAVALRGMQPTFALKEPLSITAVAAFGMAFADYVRHVLGENFTKQIEISELDRIFALPDTRSK